MEEEVKKLIEEFGYWNDHPNFGAEDWRIEVADRDTKASYWEWVFSQIQMEEDDESAG